MSNEISVIRQSVLRMQPEFRNALPSHIPVERFVRTVMTSIQSNPDLVRADKASLFSSATKCAQDGLLPDGREAAFVVFSTKDKASGEWIKKVQYIPMVQGIMKKARNSGDINSIVAHVVRKNDDFSYDVASDKVPHHKPDWFGERGDVVGAYAIIHLKEGDPIVEIMSKNDIEAIRSRSKSKDSGPWVTDWEEMARKTVIKRACKYAPSSTDKELSGVIERDEEDDDSLKLVDDVSEVEKSDPVLSKLEAVEAQASSSTVLLEANKTTGEQL